MRPFRPETWLWIHRALLLAILLCLAGSVLAGKEGRWGAWMNTVSGLVLLLALAWLLLLLRRGFLRLALNLDSWLDRGFLALLLALVPMGIQFSGISPTLLLLWKLVKWVVVVWIIWRLLGVVRIQGQEAERQRRLAAEAREQALRGRLAPHFLFNTLNTLHAQIESNPSAAQATTERLAWLFRKVLAYSDQPVIPLIEEWQLAEAYLGIEQVRLGERLRVRVEIPEELERLEIPPLSLQVLVENAVKHGVAPLEQGGEVRVRAELERPGRLRLTVEDPGPGLSARRGTGTALETLRQRLRDPGDLELGMTGGRHRASFVWSTP
jgi:two-component system sensor histidine kinase AlgZ